MGSEWKKANTDIFWGEIAPCDHILQIYENDEIFLDTLTRFIGGGINTGDSSIIISTQNHLDAVNNGLKNHGINVDALISDNSFIPLNAQETLSKFMINGWPDEYLFNQTVSQLLKKAQGANKRKVRAFGEMVAILWAQGYNGATVQLEHLWNNFCQKEAFCLFCAYPKSGFTDDMSDSLNNICSAHAKIIKGSQKHLSEIFYKETK